MFNQANSKSNETDELKFNYAVNDHKMKLTTPAGSHLLKVISEAYNDYPKRTRIQTIKKTKETIEIVLTNLLYAFATSNGWIAISRNRNQYGIDKWTTYTCLMSALRALSHIPVFNEDGTSHTTNLVSFKKGFQNKETGFSQQSKYRLNAQAFLDLLIHLDLYSSGGIEELITNSNYPTTVGLRTKTLNFTFSTPLEPLFVIKENGSREPVREEFDTPEISPARERLKSYTEKLGEAKVQLFLSNSELELLRCAMLAKSKDRRNGSEYRTSIPETLAGALGLKPAKLQRIFGDTKFKTHGRFYRGWWQEIPREYRKFITIDGEPTVELDYKALNPSLIYHKMGLELEGDPYHLNEYPNIPRTNVKEAMLSLISAKGDQKLTALGVIDDLYDLTPAAFEKAIREQHRAIEAWFRAGRWAELMRIDSEIADIVISMMLQQHDVLALPIHDSFVVPESDEDRLKEIMLSVYAAKMGSEIVIEKDADIWSSNVFLSSNDDTLANHLKHLKPLLNEYSDYLAETVIEHLPEHFSKYSIYYNRLLEDTHLQKIQFYKTLKSQATPTTQLGLISNAVAIGAST